MNMQLYLDNKEQELLIKVLNSYIDMMSDDEDDEQDNSEEISYAASLRTKINFS